MLIALALLASARAAEPTPPVTDSADRVTTAVVVPAAPDAVRAVLADPTAACRLSADVLSARVVGADGPCALIAVTTRGLTSPLSYTTRRCPSADGYTETLVQTDDFDQQDARWRLRAVPGGTEVTLQVRSQPRLPVPQRIINATVGSSAVQALKALVQRVTGR